MTLDRDRRWSRRSVLRGSGAVVLAGGGTASLFGEAFAQGATGSSPRRIDVHHHCFPPAWLAAKRSAVVGVADSAPNVMLQWTPQRSLEQLDRYGIATAILSVGDPGVWYGDVAEGRRLARLCNEYMAGLARNHPGRFGMFAALPWPDVEGTLAEIDHAYGTLAADGVHLLTSYGDIWPGDPRFEPIYAELDRRKAVVFVHPVTPSCCTKLQPGIAASIAEFGFDETRAAMSLLYNGVVTRHPDIRFIFTHAGGPVPILATRMEQQMRHPQIARNLPDGVVPALRRLYFDVANSTVNRSAMDAMTDLMPKDHIVFGSDYPYVRVEKTVTGLGQLGYAPEFVAAIDRGTAARLMPQRA